MNDQPTTWRQQVLRYAQDINQYVDKGMREGWDTCGEEPTMADTEHLLAPFCAALKAINRPGVSTAEREAFRDQWPPAHTPVIPLLQKEEGRRVATLVLLDNGSVLARLGASYEAGSVVHIDGDEVRPVEGVTFVGRCPLRRHLALAGDEGVTVTEGWQGPVVATMPWPTGLEDLPEGLPGKAFDGPPAPTQLIPFPGGRRVLLVSAGGIFVLAPEGARRLLPLQEELQEALQDEDHEPGEMYSANLSMEHGAVSPNGRWIAAGCQDGRHVVFDADLRLVAKVGPVGEYPHFALFSTHGDRLILNACHFYNGATLGVAVTDLPGLDTDFYADDPRTPTLQSGARVYAGAHRADEFIVGDAHGYLRAFCETGEARWQHFIGSTVTAMDISADGKALVAATCAGFVSFIRLDDGQAAPWQIGTGPHRETHRWVFWKSFPPLLW